jgi:branched-chain amino acid transport system substrate-binding protein
MAVRTVAAAIAIAGISLLAAVPLKAATGPEPIKIGAIFAVSGPASNLGLPEASTAVMMVAKINAKGGIMGHKVILLLKDSQSDPQKAMSLAKQLIDEEKVFAIIGPSTSGESLKIKQLCNDSHTILISCAAAEAIILPVTPWVFNTAQKDAFAARKIFETMKALSLSRIAIASSNTGFGKAGKAQLEKLAPEYGIEILANEVYEKEATDLTGLLTKIKAANPQAVVNWSIEPAQAILAKNMRQIGLTCPLFQSHGFANIRYVKTAGAAAEGIIFPSGRLITAEALPKDNPQKPVLMEYKKSYEKEYKEDVSTFGGHVYDALMLLSRAVEAAGDLDREKVRSALENIKGYVGIGGIFNLSPADHNGMDINAFAMQTVKGGKFVPYTGK